MQLSWHDDYVTERNLNSLDIPWELTTIRFSEIDLRASQYNGARLSTPILSDKIADYQSAMEAGDSFPRIVVMKTPNGYLVLSGNQRSQAVGKLIAEGKLAKNVQIPVYFVKTNEKMVIEEFFRTSNNQHGQGLTSSERLAHAVHQVQTYGISVKDASRRHNVSTASIYQHIRADAARKKLQKMGTNATTIPTTVLADLETVSYDEPAFRQLSSVIVEHSPSTEQVRMTVAAVNKSKSTTARTALIHKLATECKRRQGKAAKCRKSGVTATVNGRLQRPRRDKVMSHATQLANFLDFGNGGEGFTTLEQLQITDPEEAKELTDLLERIAFRTKMLASKKR